MLLCLCAAHCCRALLHACWIEQRAPPPAARPQDGSKVTIVRRWQPAVWPDYSTLPLPPGTERRQFRGTKAAAEAHAQAAEAAGMPASAADGDSPWHATYDAAFWATRGYGPEHMPAAVHAVALERQRMAAMTAHLAQQRALMQQQRARGLSTAAEADEFDAGLFKEAAGGWLLEQGRQWHLLISSSCKLQGSCCRTLNRSVLVLHPRDLPRRGRGGYASRLPAHAWLRGGRGLAGRRRAAAAAAGRAAAARRVGFNFLCCNHAVAMLCVPLPFPLVPAAPEPRSSSHLPVPLCPLCPPDLPCRRRLVR